VRIKSLTPEEMAAIRPSLLSFCRKYGDRRITHRALRWFRRLPHTRWKQGTLVAIATEEKRLVGVIAFAAAVAFLYRWTKRQAKERVEA